MMTRYRQFKHRVFEVLEPGDKERRLGWLFEHLIVFLILLSVLMVVLESFEGFYAAHRLLSDITEYITIFVFTLEYVLRIWTAEFEFPAHKPWVASYLYIVSPLALIDLLAILPFYLPMLITVDLRFLRILRLMRILRILKLSRYSHALNLIRVTLKKKREELLITVAMMFLLLLVASTLMYDIEHEAQPDAFPNIIASFWWAVATLTTVGYGDVYPVTGWGRLLSGIIAVLGIGLVALPTAIISTSFLEELKMKLDPNQKEESPNYCPHCGKKLR